MRTVRVLVAVRPSVSVATQSMVSVAIWLVSMTMPLRIRRVLPQCGHRRGGLTVCGTRGRAREVAIREKMVALPRPRHVTDFGRFGSVPWLG